MAHPCQNADSFFVLLLPMQFPAKASWEAMHDSSSAWTLSHPHSRPGILDVLFLTGLLQAFDELANRWKNALSLSDSVIAFQVDENT